MVIISYFSTKVHIFFHKSEKSLCEKTYFHTLLMFLVHRVAISQKDVTQKYHNPIADSFVKYVTVTIIIQDIVNGSHPSHFKFGESNLSTIADKHPSVHNDKCTKDKTNKKRVPVCT